MPGTTKQLALEDELANAAREWAEDDYVDTLCADAVREALKKHKAAGNPIAEWENGHVVVIPPDQIDIPEYDRAPQ